MKTFQARAIVLREYEAGESDKRLVLLCKGYGRLTAYARGARKPKSKFLAASQIGTYGDYVLADGRQFFSVAQASPIEQFYPIRTDYLRLCHAMCALEVCEKTLLPQAPCDDLLLLLLKTLQHLSGSQLVPSQVLRVFLFRFFGFYGLAPEMDACSRCGNQDLARTAFCEQGLLCPPCQKQAHSLPLSAAAQAAIRHILHSDLRQAFRFQAHDAVLEELAQAARLCWLCHFETPLQSEALL